jgi:hypothetical protein
MMRNKKIIEYNLDFYELEQDIFEPDELFYFRAWYIMSNLKNEDFETFETLIKKSRIIVNEQYYECTY